MAYGSPKNVFFNARKVNAATSTIPTPVIRTATGYAFQTPSRIVISAANPLKPGMPIEAADAMTKAEGGERQCAAQIHRRERVEIARVGAAINHAPGHGEEQGGDHAMRKHLQDRAADAEHVGRRQSEQHESHVADARIADDEFQVPLPQRDRRGINDPDHAEHGDPVAHIWNPSGNRFIATRNAP